MDTFLAASCGQGLSWHTVMLQGLGSYFAYEPVLKALQWAEMPLQHLLPLPASQEDAAGEQSMPNAKPCLAPLLKCHISGGLAVVCMLSGVETQHADLFESLSPLACVPWSLSGWNSLSPSGRHQEEDNASSLPVV